MLVICKVLQTIKFIKSNFIKIRGFCFGIYQYNSKNCNFYFINNNQCVG